MNEIYEKLTSPSEFVNDEPAEFAAVDKDLLPGPVDGKHPVSTV